MSSNSQLWGFYFLLEQLPCKQPLVTLKHARKIHFWSFAESFLITTKFLLHLKVSRPVNWTMLWTKWKIMNASLPQTIRTSLPGLFYCCSCHSSSCFQLYNLNWTLTYFHIYSNPGAQRSMNSHQWLLGSNQSDPKTCWCVITGKILVIRLWNSSITFSMEKWGSLFQFNALPFHS